ncbi:hypothetical protein HH214_07725 [Mucilaginibacter robiniae]|uniref:Uncharacterized protein n=1 Tax=Mucilaginibacter robiniae TaxID=2728022 RepID=A0A7L5E5Y2_9SPHI|nr:DUF6882 domain-containing protein [Mucilaginibacter robiniae]QJD95766.1 hypothetical protein HH214_07725 [Mucilaginibacter robiniae]
MEKISEWVQPIKTNEFESLSKKAYTYMFEQQEIVQQKYGLTGYESWYYDQGAGVLTFSDNGMVKLKIDYEEVGTISKISNTWLWSWANPHIDEKVKMAILAVKEYGIENNIKALTKEKWYADEYDGWEMTAIAAYLIKAKGAYRVPLENTISFMLFKNIID